MADEDDTVHYTGAEGGWGSVRGIVETTLRERPTLAALNTLRRQNKPKGFMCVSCAWTKPEGTAHLRILRERRQGHALGAHQPALHARGAGQA